jgi:hypothetical protein
MVSFFIERGWHVDGIDNNMRARFFGPAGDTRWNQTRLEKEYAAFTHHELDIRDREGVHDLIKQLKRRRLSMPRPGRLTIARPTFPLTTSRRTR